MHNFMRRVNLGFLRLLCEVQDKHLQGDTSGSVQPLVDIKTNVAFKYMLLILKQNFCFDVNGRFGTSCLVTLYRNL